MRGLQLEHASRGVADASVARAVTRLLEHSRGVGGLLQALHENSDLHSAVTVSTWFECVPHVYAWVDNILEFAQEALVEFGDDHEGFAGAMQRLATCSAWRAEHLVSPLIDGAVVAHRRADDDAQIDLLLALDLRIACLEAALAQIAQGPS
jgi:hypothetical protein